MKNTEQEDRRFQKLQQEAKSLGVTVVEMLLTRSALYWGIMLNTPRSYEANHIRQTAGGE